MRTPERKDTLGTEVEHNRKPVDRRHREVAAVAPETHGAVPVGRGHGQDQEVGQRVVGKAHTEVAEEAGTANRAVDSGAHHPGTLVVQTDRSR